MDHDIFFDCPLCNHTIKASSSLVGVPVACPDCGNEIKVPRILDGLNPRFRSQQKLAQGKASPGLRHAVEELTHLEMEMRSLLRRQRQQLRQLTFLEDNCTLVCKQLKLLPRSAAGSPVPYTGEGADRGLTASEVSKPAWERWSFACGVLTLLVTVTVGLLYFVVA